MADTKKHDVDDIETVENAVTAELTENDDLVEYIQPSNLEILKARYAAVEEDEQIRSEGFQLAKKSGLIRKPRPENTVFDYYATSTNAKDEIRTDVDSPLSQVFDSTRSEFDADSVSFSDIGFEQEKKDSEKETEKAEISATEQKAVDEETSAPLNRYGFDTHTRVIFLDESADDGIKRNTDDELSAAFSSDDNDKKRRRMPWSAKKK